MLLIDRRNRRSVQIFLALSSFLLFSGIFYWFFRISEWEETDIISEEARENKKSDRQLALEKVRKLQKGLNEVAGNTVYDDPSKNTLSENRDNLENSRDLIRGFNVTAVREGLRNRALDSENGVGSNGRMTVDSFYDDKLKQKQEEDRIVEQDEEDVVDKNVISPSESIHQNETVSRDLVGNSAAVQTWLAKQDGVHKPLSDIESNLKMRSIEEASRYRNPKFVAVDPSIEKRNNQIHNFKFVQ